LALKYLKDTEVNLNNVLIMIGDFNIRNNFWDPNFPYYSSHRNTLFNITDSFQLKLSNPTEFFPTRYSDNVQDSNSVLNLVFLYPNSLEHNNRCIYLNWRLISDHIPITVDILLVKEYIQTTKHSLIKNSEEKDHFIDKLINFINSLKTDFIQDIIILEEVIQSLTNNIDRI